MTFADRHVSAGVTLLGRPNEAYSHYTGCVEVARETRFCPEIALSSVDCPLSLSRETTPYHIPSFYVMSSGNKSIKSTPLMVKSEIKDYLPRLS